MNTTHNRNIFWLALVAVFIAAASVYSLLNSYHSEAESHRRVLIGRGHTVLDALKAGILAHGRMGRYRGDRLGIIFDELAKTPDILALELRGPDGKVVASGGNKEEIPETLTEKSRWEANRLIMATHVNLLAECGPGNAGRGRHGWEDMEDWTSFSQGVYVLSATLDASEVYGAIRRHQFQLAFSISVVFAALASGTLALALLLKRSEWAVLLERERERTRRQEQIARLGAGLAHETKNPLGIVRGLAQSIGNCDHHVCPLKDRTKNIVDEVDRAIGVINSFLALARPQEATLAPVDLDRFFENFLPLVQMDASAAEVNIQYVPSKLTIIADEDLLRRALLNLILNALRASVPGQKVQIETVREASTLTLRVSDTGCGIAPEDVPRVTEPYFTRFSGGSGLGLSMVSQITAAHGWRLTITSAVGQGTRASLEGISIVEASA